MCTCSDAFIVRIYDRWNHQGARWPSGLERWLVQATGLSWPGSNPTAENFASELWQFRLPRFPLSEETLKAVGPFYLVSMPGEVKDPTSPHWNVLLS